MLTTQSAHTCTHTQGHDLTVPIICDDGVQAMFQKDIPKRDKAIRKALSNLLAFYKHMAILHPGRTYLPYEDERSWTLPILPRLRQRKNQGDPTWIFNTPHFCHARRIGMMTRMFDPKCKEYHLYGGAPRIGPRMDPNFTGPYPFAYNVVAALQFTIAVEIVLGRPASKDETMDKTSNNHGYVISNTRWADKRVQAQNRDNYKWALRETPIPRNPIPYRGANRQHYIKRRTNGKPSRGKWTAHKRITPVQKLKRMASSYLTRRRRYTPKTGRQRRALRAGKDVRGFFRYLFTPAEEIHASDTFSRYTSSTSRVHHINPSGHNTKKHAGR